MQTCEKSGPGPVEFRSVGLCAPEMRMVLSVEMGGGQFAAETIGEIGDRWALCFFRFVCRLSRARGWTGEI